MGFSPHAEHRSFPTPCIRDYLGARAVCINYGLLFDCWFVFFRHIFFLRKGLLAPSLKIKYTTTTNPSTEKVNYFTIRK